MKNTVISFLFLTLVFSGCAAKKPPLEAISDAKTALAKAKEVGADKLSPNTFELANRHYEQIQPLMDKQNFIEAKYAAQKALIQAKLSQTRAQNSKIQKQVDELSGEVNTINKEFTTISE